VKKNIALLYGFSFFDQFMIVIALWSPISRRRASACDMGKLFSRGPDVIPRGTFALLYRSLTNDDGEMTAELLTKKLQGKIRLGTRSLGPSSLGSTTLGSR
jgi:hypothetical protein